MDANKTALVKLSEREQSVLQYIVQDFIISANPVASKQLAKQLELNVSSATIRNTMHLLEEKGLLSHPHTSAGRVPTDRGYRYYVNSLMELQELDANSQALIQEIDRGFTKDMDSGFQQTARIMARISNLLAVVITPKLADSILRNIQVISLSSHRLLIVLTIEQGLAKTLTIEIESEISTAEIQESAQRLNERLSGHKLNEIADKIAEMLADFGTEAQTGLIRVFIDSAESIFDDHVFQRFHFGGVEYMPMHPEFSDLKQYRGIVELIEDENLIVHLLENQDKDEPISITIGKENILEQAEQCSIVSARFNVGKHLGKVGLVGPTRMDYPKLVALIEQITNRINKLE